MMRPTSIVSHGVTHIRVRCGGEQLPLGHVVVAVLGNVMDRGGDAVKVRKFRLKLSFLFHLVGRLDIKYESNRRTANPLSLLAGRRIDCHCNQRSER